MFPKRLLSLTTALLALALLTITIPGCQKEFVDESLNQADQDLQFLGGGGACDNGVKLLQMAYQLNPLIPVNKHVVLLNNGVQEELQNLNNTSSDNLLKIYAINGVITWGDKYIGVTGEGLNDYISGTEKLRIKLGTSANLIDWKMLCAGLWINAQAGATINIQMRRNGANVQPPVIKSYPSGGRDHVTLSYFYMFDEIEVSASAGEVQLLNSATNGTAYNRFIISNNSNDFVALRVRKGGYFWNSLVSNDHQSISNPDNQFLVTGNFVPTSNADEWIFDVASPSFINKKVNCFGPSIAANNDHSIDKGETMSFKIGSDVGAGASFTNAILPIFRPGSGAAFPRIILNKNGSQVAAFNLSQQPATLQYHLIGASGVDFDEIIFTTTVTSPPGSRYEFQSDYWSVARFSLCQSGGGGMMLQNMREEDMDELAPAAWEE